MSFARAARVALVFLVAPLVALPQPHTSGYRLPPDPIPAILDAAPTPDAVVAPGGARVVYLQPRSMPPIAELAQPMARLAGIRFNPRSSAPVGGSSYVSLAVQDLPDGEMRTANLPAADGTRLLDIGVAPDGSRYAVAVATTDAVELWVVDLSTAHATRHDGIRLNAIFGEPCEWLADSSGLLCLVVPETRGAPPEQPSVPVGPNIQENVGRPAPVRTYQDLLTSAHDEALFAHHATSTLVFVPLTGTPTRIGADGLFTAASPSPDGRFVLVEALERPFSWLVRYPSFPKFVHVRDRSTGAAVQTVARLPLADRVPIAGVPTGPRDVRWVPTEPSRLFWAEALDQGDPKREVSHRDRLVSLDIPTRAAPREVYRTALRFAAAAWTDTGTLLVNELDRPSRRLRTWRLGVTPSDAHLLFDRLTDDAYAHPGTPYVPPGRRTVLQHGDAIYLIGTGASPEGDRPFVDRLHLTSLATERQFRSSGAAYEQVLAVVDADGTRLLTRHETPTSPPNYVLRTLPDGRQALTDFPDPSPQLTGVSRQLITYTRADGVQLSGTLYLPPGHEAGGTWPLLMWAYPTEYSSAATASQISSSPHRFMSIRGASHLLLLTQGYAILDNPSMPIVGEDDTANDTYVEQLVASAEAAVDHVVTLGVADQHRIGVGGHSYGAFMTANLLAHTDLFRAGIARSGAYNRTLTPFGFQAERRTFWEVPDLYARMSPFWHAHRINEPILLLHGEVDNNAGTFPIQSERLYMALKGHGATVRYVTLPHESHGYTARESVLHTVAEMVDWMNVHVKTPPPATDDQASVQR
jgi:dipeptidyl aminopeptidase/acylaminoacyl peptidase